MKRWRRRLATITAMGVLAAAGGLLALDLAVRWMGPQGASGEGVPATELRGRVETTIQHLASALNRRTADEQARAAQWLAERCRELGYHVWLQDYEHEGATWTNVIVSHAPLDPAQEYVVAMAHYDSITWETGASAPGADDNGSGVAVLLEAARTLANAETGLPVVYCFFANEERGRPGSKVFVSWAKENGIRIRAAVNVDVVGYPRPKRLLDWEVVAAPVSWKGRARAVRAQLRNGLFALRGATHALTVGGRPPNAGLGQRVAESLRSTEGLAVQERIREDCG